jgi:hypothetical protein
MSEARADNGGSLGIDKESRVARGRLPVPKPDSRFRALVDPPIRAASSSVDRIDRARPLGLRHPHHAPNEGFAHLSPYEEPPRSPVAAGACQAREHCRKSRIEVDDALEIAELTEV